jgi:hypothetical protein
MNIRQRWKQTTIANKLMVWTTTIVAFGTLVQVGIGLFQYWLVKESGEQATKQTDRLIAAYERISNTSIEALNEVKRSNTEAANKAERAVNASESFADAATQQANTSAQTARASEISARAAEAGVKTSIDRLEYELRPYVHPTVVEMLKLELGKPVSMRVTLQNTGKTPAVDLKIRFQAAYGTPDAEIPDKIEYYGKPIEGRPFLGSGMPSYLTTDESELVPYVKRIKDSEIRIYILGDVDYDDIIDIKTRFYSEFCFYYVPVRNAFEPCKKHNQIK